MTTQKTTIVIGFGNPFMGDEGIGNALVEELSKHSSSLPHVQFLDLGTSGPSLIHHLSGFQKAIIIDCSFMNTEPGTLRYFRPDEVATKGGLLPHLSLHQGDVLGMIELARSLGECPEDIMIVGIEPKLVQPQDGISAQLQNNIDRYIKTITEQLL